MTFNTTEERKPIPPDAILSAVANDERRAVLRSLNHTDETAMEFDALVDQVVEHTREGVGGSLEEDHRQRVRTRLYHSHLPKLEACGLITRDSDTEQVRNATDELDRELLTVIDAYEAGV